MNTGQDHTAVAIVGAGVAGLALGNFLLRNGIECVILERHSREHVEQRQRAGSLDGTGVRILREWQLDEVVAGHSSGFEDAGEIPVRIDGITHYWNAAGDDDEGIFCTQQTLVRNLIAVFLRDGGDVRFGAEHVSLDGLATAEPRVSYRTPGGSTVITCDLVAGCDGDRGVSRTAAPPDALTRHSLEHGYAWLAVLADVPAHPPATMAVHSRGFAAQITRGAEASRFYLQCPLGDTVEQWPDARIWSELAMRFGESTVPTGRITDRQIVPLRSVVYSPMSHGPLHLLGDAAHIVSPMSAKGMSLALHDADVFARAVLSRFRRDDASLLDAYSDTCLRRVWRTQVEAVWITEVMHNAGDAFHAGEFRRQLARTQLRTMTDLTPPAAAPR